MTSPFNWPWKTTRKLLLNCQNPSTGSKDTVKLIFLSADVTVGLALKNYPKIPLDQKLWRCLFSCQLMCTVISLLDWPWKNTPKWFLTLWNPSTGSEVMEIFSSISADVYSDLIIGLASKNYQKMTLKFPKSIHWFKRYSEINQFLCQLMCSVTSPMDWPWKTTLNWPLTLWNLSTVSEVMEMSFFMSADVYSDLTIGFALKKCLKMKKKIQVNRILVKNNQVKKN